MLRRTCAATRSFFEPARVRARAAMAAGADGDAALELMMTETAGSDNARALSLAAAGADRVDVLQRMQDAGLEIDFGDVCDAAIEAGRLRVVQAFASRIEPGCSDSVHTAATAGNAAALQWLNDNGWPVPDYVAAYSGSHAVLQWFAARAGGECPLRSPSDLAAACSTAVLKADTEMLRYLYANGARPPTPDSLVFSVSSGKPAMLDVVYTAFCSANPTPEHLPLCEAAIEAGDVAALRYLLANGQRLTAADVCCAIESGGAGMVREVLSHDPPCDADVMDAALDEGNREAVRWAAARGWTAKNRSL
jgi:hypothetical protein